MLQLKELYMGSNTTIEHLIYVSWPTSNSKALTYWSDKDDSFITGQNLARVYIKLNKFFIPCLENTIKKIVNKEFTSWHIQWVTKY